MNGRGTQGAGPAESGGQGSGGTRREAVIRPRVLIVDDEPMIGATLRVLLEADNDVSVAQSGAQARQLLAAHEFDLILCDLTMPGESGMDLHRWLATRTPRAADRMVFMTGGVFTDEAREFLDGVDNRKLEKPFETADLLTVMREALASSGRPAR